MQDIQQRIKDHFPLIIQNDLIETIGNKGKIILIKAGERLLDIGQYVKMIPLVTKGAIKVLRQDDDGAELFLYFLYPGNTCTMTVQCCRANLPSEIIAIAEEDTELIALPVEIMDTWMREYDDWRQFILTSYSDRFYELLKTIDSVVFHKLDERLLEYLEEKKKIAGTGTLHISHQEIANDLHSSREVISRLLKQMEKNGQLKLGRNKIEFKLTPTQNI